MWAQFEWYVEAARNKAVNGRWQLQQQTVGTQGAGGRIYSFRILVLRKCDTTLISPRECFIILKHPSQRGPGSFPTGGLRITEPD